MLETNKLRNVAQYFAHLLHSDAIAWTVFEHIHMNERETNSSKRIFVKILFKELAEFLGLEKLNSRMQDDDMIEFFQYLMPRSNPDNIRFSINFFTSIGLGALTVPMREILKALKANPQAAASTSSSFSSGSSSSSLSSSDSSSGSSSSGSSSSGSSSSGSSSSGSSSSDSSY
jgi:pre-mRNA-splicing factor CWC22